MQLLLLKTRNLVTVDDTAKAESPISAAQSHSHMNCMLIAATLSKWVGCSSECPQGFSSASQPRL